MKTYLRWLLGALAAAISLQAQGQPLCKLPLLEKLSVNHPECLFFSGTAQFREENFEKAARFWQQLLDLKQMPIELEFLRTDAYNNLGFLYFTGKGVPQDRVKAMAYWSTAYKAGHEEAAYHLCHAFVESQQSAQRALGLGYCKEAKRRYGRLDLEERKAAHATLVEIERLAKTVEQAGK